MIANILSIAGSDPSGGAGVQADLKTFSARGCYGMAAATALTAQNTRGVRAIHLPPSDFLIAQIDAIFEDISVDAVKIGMLGAGALVQAVAARLRHWGARNIVLDPVLIATSGDPLGAEDVARAMIAHLFPLACVVTPNLSEAASLTGGDQPRDLREMRASAQKLIDLGAKAVLMKGGHADSAHAEDLLIAPPFERIYSAQRVATRNTHGTGCALSSAIAAELGKGQDLFAAVEIAKQFVTRALQTSDVLSVGAGCGPLNHFEFSA